MTTVRAAVIQCYANMPKDEAIDKHIELIGKAAAEGAKVTCLQEIFHGPYFPAEQAPKWYRTAEPENGPTITRMREVAKQHNMVLVVPWYEEAQTGVYYNSAAVIEADRQVGLKGAELVFNPSATVESLSKYLWQLEQPAHAVANGYWIAAINRVGVEEPLSTAKFYGSSYFCNPRGQII